MQSNCGAALRLAVALWVLPRVASADDAADPRIAVLEQALSMIEARAYRLPRIDWPATQRTAHATLAATPGDPGLTAAICGVLRELDDGHSFYLPPPPAGRICFATPRARPAMPPPPKAPIAELDASGRWPRVAVNRWSGSWPQAASAARQVRDALVQATAAAPCGLIVDLRADSGGSVWPMIAGLAPLYPPGTLQTWIDRDGGASEMALDADGLRDGPNRIGLPVADLPAVAHPPRYVAVLWGEWTASAGELTAIAFAGQPNVRSFGAPSVGQTTSNASIRLPNGGTLAVMTSRVRDRTGRDVEGALVPDERSDAPIDAAQAWLAAECAAPG